MSKKVNKKKNDESDDDMSEIVEETENDQLDDDIEDDEEIINDDDDIEETDDNVESGETDPKNNCILGKMIDEDVDFFDNLENSEIQEKKEGNQLKGENRISSSRLSKYEMVRILGERTKQLTMGAKPLIKNHETLSYDQIAEEELKLNMVPYKIKRHLPNGQYEIWTLDELYKDHLMSQLE